MEKIINTKIIEDYIEQNNLSIAKFCEMCQICRQTYKQIMKQEDYDYDLKILFRIARILNVQICELFLKQKNR